MQYSSYLVCNEYITQVQDFLSQFFKERVNGYNFAGWRTFEVGNMGFTVNLMDDKKLPMTQHMTFDLYCDSLAELEALAKKHNVELQNFISTSTPNRYRYHYAEIKGPQDICKIEISYTEDLE